MCSIIPPVRKSWAKAVGDDFREGKITLLRHPGLQRGDDAERAFWRRTMEDLDQDEGGADLAQAIGLMESMGCLEETIRRARHYGDLARDALAVFPDSAAKAALAEIVDFAFAAPTDINAPFPVCEAQSLAL